MRRLTTFDDEQRARTLGDVLYAQGIENMLRGDDGGKIAVWVYEEGKVSEARKILSKFETELGRSEIAELRARGKKQRKRQETDRKSARHREIDMGRRLRSAGPGYGRVTIFLIAICCIVFLLREIGTSMEALLIGRVSDAIRGEPFARVLEGEVWRLITPIFLHFHFLHILFNMWWLLDLGTAVERHRSSGFIAVFVVVTGILSNTAQYVFAGNPLFGGMSGVVYALLGYVWLRSRFDARSGLYLHRPIVILMLLWLVFGFTGMFIRMANIAHLSGLLLGCAWGYVSSGDLRLRLGR